jgi:hypothetical protein
VETEHRSTAPAALEAVRPARMWMLDRLRALEAEDALQTKPLAQTSRDTVYKDLSREHIRREAKTHREVSQSANPPSPEERWAQEPALSLASPTGFFGEAEELIQVACSGHNVCGSASLQSQLACCDSFAPSSDPNDDHLNVRSAVGEMKGNGQQQVVLEYDASIQQEVVITEAFAKHVRSPPVETQQHHRMPKFFNSQDLHDWVVVGRSTVRDDEKGLGAVGSSSWYRCGHLPRAPMVNVHTRAPMDIDAAGPTKTTAAPTAAVERGTVGAFDPQSFRSGGAVCIPPASMQTKNYYAHTLCPEAVPAVEPISVQVVPRTPKTSSIATAQAQTNGDAEHSGLGSIIDFKNRPRDEWISANSQRILQAR